MCDFISICDIGCGWNDLFGNKRDCGCNCTSKNHWCVSDLNSVWFKSLVVVVYTVVVRDELVVVVVVVAYVVGYPCGCMVAGDVTLHARLMHMEEPLAMSPCVILCVN